uniref:Uncharacterized protein n=1 Tax=Davidia involucrata TaxID=16924 RepID=A0A5B7AT87_DAVIN
MEGREGDPRIPIISCLFFLFVVTGGVLLCLYVLDSKVSRPWFPIAALALIGSPWIFWFLMYIYTCIKSCCRRRGAAPASKDRQISRRSNRSIPPGSSAAAATAGGTTTMSCTTPGESPVNSPNGHRKVHFGGAVVVMDGNHDGGGGESSVPSSRECEMPLTLSVKS